MDATLAVAIAASVQSKYAAAPNNSITMARFTGRVVPPYIFT